MMEERQRIEDCSETLGKESSELEKREADFGTLLPSKVPVICSA